MHRVVILPSFNSNHRTKNTKYYNNIGCSKVACVLCHTQYIFQMCIVLLDKSDIQFLPFHKFVVYSPNQNDAFATVLLYLFRISFMAIFCYDFQFFHFLMPYSVALLFSQFFFLNCTVIACNKNVSFPFILSLFFHFSHSSQWYFNSSLYSLRTMHYFHDILKYKCLLFSLFYFFHVSCLLLPSPTISHISATPNVLNQIALVHNIKLPFFICSYRL